MSAKLRLCQICLRGDRTLKIVDCMLSDFHDELCDFNLSTENLLYCGECEYLLRKIYNFRLKCIKACKIYKKWLKSKPGEKKAPDILCTLLPQVSLNIWLPSTSVVYEYSHIEPNENTLGEPNTHIDVMRESDSTVTIVRESGSNAVYTLEAFKEANGNILHQDDVSKMEIESDTESSAFSLHDTLKLEDKVDGDISFKNRISSLKAKSEEFHLKNNLNNGASIKNENIENSSINNKNSSKATCSDYKIEKRTTVRNISKKNVSKSFDDKNCLDIEDFLNESSSEEDNKLNDIKSQRNNAKAKILRRMKLKQILKDISSDDSDTEDVKSTRKNLDSAVKMIAKDGDVVKKKVMNKKKIISGRMINVVMSNSNEKHLHFKVPFTKERLISRLKSLFESCGELTTDEGMLIDKDFVVGSIDDTITELLTQRLWKAVRQARTVKPQALKLFACIQKKYKFDHDEAFDVVYLNTKEKALQEFQERKNYECYVKSQFKCEMCYQGFKYDAFWKNHKKLHEESAGDHVCTICGLRHKSKRELMRHNKYHEAVFKCKLCPFVTYYKSSMLNHQLRHMGVKFPCVKCDRIFKSKSAYKNHMSYTHEKCHTCTTCERTFSTQAGLKWHRTREHEGPPSEKVHCTKCSLAFRTQKSLSKHIALVHEVTPRGRRAGTTFPKGTKKPVITCKVCNTVGHSVGWLGLHYRLEHPALDVNEVQYGDKKVHLCDVCGKGFTIHIGDRRYKCKFCSKGFLHRASLNEHVRGVHYNERRVRKKAADAITIASESSSCSNNI